MQIVNSAKELRQTLDRLRLSAKKIGFVPTMGFLHEGHLSLVERCKKENDVVVVSIFVNPTQFNVSSDLENYPKDLDNDCEILERSGTDYLFLPSVSEMYNIDSSGKTVTDIKISCGEVNSVFEGAFRSGHFDGVALVVNKLFNIVGECRTYFGLKDYQQVYLISKLIQELFLPIEMVKCPTVRQESGLALSSRNARLTDKELVLANEIYFAMKEGKRMIESGITETKKVIELIKNHILKTEGIKLEYVSIVKEDTLVVPELLTDKVRILIAGWLGNVRLIDNLEVNCNSELKDELFEHHLSDSSIISERKIKV